MNNNSSINDGIDHPIVFTIPDRVSISEIRRQQDIVDNYNLCTDAAKIEESVRIGAAQTVQNGLTIFHPLFPSQETTFQTTPRKRKVLEIRAPANDTSSEKKNCFDSPGMFLFNFLSTSTNYN